MADNTDSMKVCTRCTFTCSYDTAPMYFCRGKSRKDGFAYWCKACDKQYREDNKEAILKKKREYYQKNKEKHAEWRKEWRQNNPEKRRASDRKYRRNNLEQRNAYNRELYKEKPEVFAEARKRYYYRKQALPDTFTESDWQRCLDYWQHSCAVCGDKPDTLHQDHWIAISHKVKNHPGTSRTNIICLCHSCNSSKFNKDGREWLVDIYGNVQAGVIYGKIQAYFKLVGKKELVHENSHVAHEQRGSLQIHHRNTPSSRISHQGKPGSAD